MTPPQETIGEYVLHRLIGEGGMGQVYEASERLSQRRVALKILRNDLGQSPEGRRLFVSEMQILTRLDHPNIVRCLACSESAERLMMALEYLEGQTLRTLLRERGRLPWQRALTICAQIASALAAAHQSSEPIIHRDLKPENVMILAQDHVKVMDFGIAKVLSVATTGTAHTVGTLQYMSPEQIDASPMDGRSDLYSLGLILYEMLCGYPPFTSQSPRELLNKQCTQVAPPFPDYLRSMIPSAVESFLWQLLAKKPEQRPASATEVAHRFKEFLSVSPSSSFSGESQSRSATILLIEKANQKSHSWRWMFALGFLLLAIGLAGFASFYFFTKTDPARHLNQPTFAKLPLQLTPKSPPSPISLAPQEQPEPIAPREPRKKGFFGQISDDSETRTDNRRGLFQKLDGKKP